MENIFVLSTLIAIVYFLAKFIEMRFVLKEIKPLKFLIRETLLVYVSTVIGLFVANQFDMMKEAAASVGGGVSVFVDNPGF